MAAAAAAVPDIEDAPWVEAHRRACVAGEPMYKDPSTGYKAGGRRKLDPGSKAPSFKL